MNKTYIVKLDKDCQRVDGTPTKAVKVSKELDDKGNVLWFTEMDSMEAFFAISEEGLYCELSHFDSHRITIYDKKRKKLKVTKGAISND